jgi:hypothetical protein
VSEGVPLNSVAHCNVRAPEYGVKRSVMVCANSGYTRMLFMENRFSARIALVGEPTIVPGSPAARHRIHHRKSASNPCMTGARPVVVRLSCLTSECLLATPMHGSHGASGLTQGVEDGVLAGALDRLLVVGHV